jgi:predicted O-methyltransferase YrrM
MIFVDKIPHQNGVFVALFPKACGFMLFLTTSALFFALEMKIQPIRHFLRFYAAAVTKYQLHSPFVFEIAYAALEDTRWYYAFEHVEMLRNRMLDSQLRLNILDYGSGGHADGSPAQHTRKLSTVVRQSSSSVGQGQYLFRMVNHFQPKTILELGASVGMGTMYMASAARNARVIALEGSADCAHVARTNLDTLQLQHVEVREGPFKDTLQKALADLQQLDLVFLDGDHRMEPTLDYFEQCLAYAHDKTVFILDDMYHSEEMSRAWEVIKAHPRITLTIDFFEASMVFINPDFKVKQHFSIVPYRWKPWKFL